MKTFNSMSEIFWAILFYSFFFLKRTSGNGISIKFCYISNIRNDKRTFYWNVTLVEKLYPNLSLIEFPFGKFIDLISSQIPIYFLRKSRKKAENRLSQVVLLVVDGFFYFPAIFLKNGNKN